MPEASTTRQLLRAAVLVFGLPVAVLFARLLLDAFAGGRAWLLTPFLAVFVAARIGGTAIGFATTGVTTLVTLAGLASPVADPSEPALVTNAAFDAATGVVATAVALLSRGDPRATEARREEAARLFQRAEHAIAREQAVRDLSDDLAGSTTPRQAADAIVRRLEHLLPVRAAAVVAREDSDLWTIRDDDGFGVSPVLVARGDEVAIPAARGIAEEVLGSGELRRSSDARLPALALPLTTGSDTIGAVGLVLETAEPLDEAAAAGFVALGRLAGETLARSAEVRRLRRAAEREALALERVGRLQRLAADLARPLDADAAAAVVVDAASAGVRAPIVVLHRVVPGRGRLELLAARGYPAGLLAVESRLPLDAPLPAAEAARTGARLEIAGVDWGSRFPAASDLPAITGLHHLVAIPAGDPGPATVLLVARSGGGPFDRDELEFLGTIAQQAAQAIERADLLDALRERGRRLELTLGAARTGTWELEVDTGTLAVSGEMRRVHGLDQDDPLPDLEAYLTRIHEDDRAAVRAVIARAVERADEFSVEYRVLRSDGSVSWISSVGRSFADEAGRPRRITATDRDVTLDRLAEAERDRLLEQEREARRLQEAFVGVMSHELRTPITTIIAGAQLLLRQRGLSRGARELAEDVGDEAERLYRLVEDLLVLSRLERGNLAPEREPVHLGHLVARVIASEQARWPARTFRLTRPRGDEVAEGEDTYVEQVLRNLLSNAAKYSGPGATVEVVVEHGEDTVSVRVLDEGPGIAASEVGDLFTLFYRSPTTSAAASGAGIGLFVCDRLVRAMGGRIWARRRERGGSEFGFSLARYEDPDVVALRRDRAASAAS